MEETNVYAPPESELIEERGNASAIQELKSQNTWRLVFLTVITMGIYKIVRKGIFER